MKVLKHFWWVLTHKVKGFNCSHSNTEVASCPYTGLTYITCTECLARRSEKTV